MNELLKGSETLFVGREAERDRLSWDIVRNQHAHTPILCISDEFRRQRLRSLADAAAGDLLLRLRSCHCLQPAHLSYDLVITCVASASAA